VKDELYTLHVGQLAFDVGDDEIGPIALAERLPILEGSAGKIVDAEHGMPASR
jgi:hypothetical protein